MKKLSMSFRDNKTLTTKWYRLAKITISNTDKISANELKEDLENTLINNNISIERTYSKFFKEKLIFILKVKESDFIATKKQYKLWENDWTDEDNNRYMEKVESII